MKKGIIIKNVDRQSLADLKPGMKYYDKMEKSQIKKETKNYNFVDHGNGYSQFK